jgi:hypothetical protein
MYLGYNVDTTLGSIPAYDNEFNIPSTMIPNSLATVRYPSTDMLTSGSATLIYPLVDQLGMVKTLDGSVATLEPDIALGPSIYLMAPVNESDLPANATIGVVMIGAFPVLAAIICITLIALAGAFVFVSQYWTSAWVQTHYYEAEEAYYDYMTQCLEVISDESKDLNGDGIMDIRTIVWANGRTVSLALSDYGIEALDGETYVLEDEGTTVEPPAEPVPPPDFGWVLIAGIGLVGLFLVVKLFDKPSPGGGGIMVLGGK